MHTQRLVCLIGALVVGIAGCGGGSSGDATAASSSGGSAPSATRQLCPNPEGQACLGPIAAGTYSTRMFYPQITYTVPDGWSNFEDTPGNFLLVPPGGDLPGVDAGTGDFVGIYSGVAAPNGCEPGLAPGVGLSAGEVLGWMISNPALTASRREDVQVGGLTGVVVDVEMTPGWTGTCPYSRSQPVAPLIVGVGQTGLDHNVGPGAKTRLYLLENAGKALCIEVVDVNGGRDLDSHSSIVADIRFQS